MICISTLALTYNLYERRVAVYLYMRIVDFGIGADQFMQLVDLMLIIVSERERNYVDAQSTGLY